MSVLWEDDLALHECDGSDPDTALGSQSHCPAPRVSPFMECGAQLEKEKTSSMFYRQEINSVGSIRLSAELCSPLR